MVGVRVVHIYTYGRIILSPSFAVHSIRNCCCLPPHHNWSSQVKKAIKRLETSHGSALANCIAKNSRTSSLGV
ncbi:unnamed protein product [Coffea canephora]|uniref:Uncharacterized protein n=1 Tax=Coffea canephora TaxID=49390 RepID=A0A068TZL1_COFCA|nr:unnamed protein product [Coffea canephora]